MHFSASVLPPRATHLALTALHFILYLIVIIDYSKDSYSGTPIELVESIDNKPDGKIMKSHQAQQTKGETHETEIINQLKRINVLHAI